MLDLLRGQWLRGKPECHRKPAGQQRLMRADQTLRLCHDHVLLYAEELTVGTACLIVSNILQARRDTTGPSYAEIACRLRIIVLINVTAPRPIECQAGEEA